MMTQSPLTISATVPVNLSLQREGRRKQTYSIRAVEWQACAQACHAAADNLLHAKLGTARIHARPFTLVWLSCRSAARSCATCLLWPAWRRALQVAQNHGWPWIMYRQELRQLAQPLPRLLLGRTQHQFASI